MVLWFGTSPETSQWASGGKEGEGKRGRGMGQAEQGKNLQERGRAVVQSDDPPFYHPGGST